MVTIGPLDGPEGRNPLDYVPGVAPLFWIFYYKNRHTYLCANVGRHLKDGASRDPGSVLYASPNERSNIGQSTKEKQSAASILAKRPIPNVICNTCGYTFRQNSPRFLVSSRHIPCRLLIGSTEEVIRKDKEPYYYACRKNANSCENLIADAPRRQIPIPSCSKTLLRCFRPRFRRK